MTFEVITDESADGLSRQRWRFLLEDRRRVLHVDLWAHEIRPSRRHKWRAEKLYSRIRPGRGSVDPRKIVRKHPPVADVATMAAGALLESLRFHGLDGVVAATLSVMLAGDGDG